MRKSKILILLMFLSSTALLFSCSFGPAPPPTPGPFPFEGVRQMTFNYAFYESLLWSTNRSIIAVTRCPLLNFQPACYEHEEAILIYAETGDLLTINFQSITHYPITGYPIVWSPDGLKLLLIIREWLPEKGTASPQPQSRKIICNLDKDNFSEFQVTGGIIAWSGDGKSLLIIRRGKDDLHAIGWYGIESGDFKQEIPLTEEDCLFRCNLQFWRIPPQS